jgi:hypothetical protein
MLQDFQFKIIHRTKSRHLNVNALSQNHVGFPEEDDNFGSDVMEQEEQIGITPSPAKSNAANEVNINLFTLQHTQQGVNDAEKHQVGSESGGQNTYSLSERLPQMNHMEYKKWWLKLKPW